MSQSCYNINNAVGMNGGTFCQVQATFTTSAK